MSNGTQDWFTQNAPKTDAGGDWFSANSPESVAVAQRPDATKQAQAATVKPLTAAKVDDQLGIPKGGRLDPGIRARSNKELIGGFKTSGEITGSMVGGELVAPLLGGAEAAGGTSAILRWLLPRIARGAGMGFGAGAGAVATGSSPKEALATSGQFAAMDLGTEGAIAGAKKVIKPVAKLVKDVAKPKISVMAEEHAAEARQAEMQYQKELADHKEKVQSLKATHEQAKTEFKTAEQMKEHQQNLASTVSENLKLADKKISTQIGERFNKVSDAIEKKNPQVQITDVEREARGKLFFPDSVQAFNNIMDNFKSKMGMTDFSILRKTYSRLNEVLYGGRELPPDLYQAVKTVRDSLGKDLQKAATKAGQGEQFSQAMRDWSSYQNDWHDTSALAKGGSPIAKILKAEDPQFVIDQLQGKSGQRLIESLKGYGKYGADSGLAARLREFSARLKTLPAPKSLPEPPKIPAAPEKPAIEPFDRDAASRKILVDRLQKAIKLGLLGGGGAYAYEKLLGGHGAPLP